MSIKINSNCDLAQAVCKILKELKITYKKINKYLVCKDIKIIEQERKEYAKINNENIDKFHIPLGWLIVFVLMNLDLVLMIQLIKATQQVENLYIS